jgi:MFS family permease
MLAWFLVAIPVSSLVGSPISGLLLQLNGVWGLAGWQWLFIVEGLPAVVLGVLTLRLLADRPEEASWLTGEERDAVVAMLAAEPRERPKSALLAALKDPRV